MNRFFGIGSGTEIEVIMTQFDCKPPLVKFIRRERYWKRNEILPTVSNFSNFALLQWGKFYSNIRIIRLRSWFPHPYKPTYEFTNLNFLGWSKINVYINICRDTQDRNCEVKECLLSSNMCQRTSNIFFKKEWALGNSQKKSRHICILQNKKILYCKNMKKDN